ncbi:MAG: preprotein translocase subunit YajC [Candidatus Tokpelaia sp. JSC189]|nr:MAG: preprotein translocase subunit YajC [Candidatus Tokpelaia sp. JSC189]
MFITPAYAQAADAGISGQFSMFIPLILIFIIMYFLVIRPQRRQMKKHQEMVNLARRGDTIVTGGGLIGKVTRVYDDIGELEVEIADDVRVRVVRSIVSAVRVKGEPLTEMKSISKAKVDNAKHQKK